MVENERPDASQQASSEHARSPEQDVFEEGEERAPPGVRTMAIVRWILVAGMAALALASALDYLGAFERAQAAGPGAIYYCPMHPQIVEDRPGECPICTMTLVPKPEVERSEPLSEGMGHAPHPSSPSGSPPSSRPSDGSPPGLSPIELTPERIQLIGMRTARIERAPLINKIRTVGYVAPNEEGLAKVHARFAGWIETLFVAKTGQKVGKGDPLASIYSPEVFAAQHEFLNAKRWGARPESPGVREMMRDGLLQDARRRLELLGISSEEVDAIATSGQPARALVLRSPAGGHVTKKIAVSGLYVEPGTELFEVADLSTVWVLADIYENEISRVALKKTAHLRLESYRDRVFTGRVDFIYPLLAPDSRTLSVRMTFDNAGGALKPGMYGEVTIDLPDEAGLLAPREAIVDTGELQYVFVVLPGGRFVPRRVHIGARSADKVEVLDGLAEGEVVVTTANFLLDSESRLQAAIAGFEAGDGAPSGGGQGSTCEADFDRERFPDKYRACRACELQHRGMGTMEVDCKSAIPKPWR